MIFNELHPIFIFNLLQKIKKNSHKHKTEESFLSTFSAVKELK